ncbi:MAG TPA: hypothetical protein VFS67_13545 [Polyangiaceae bacterium]|nr:hypothetical protein [Polyangiaceae bacterium]
MTCLPLGECRLESYVTPVLATMTEAPDPLLPRPVPLLLVARGQASRRTSAAPKSS